MLLMLHHLATLSTMQSIFVSIENELVSGFNHVVCKGKISKVHPMHQSKELEKEPQSAECLGPIFGIHRCWQRSNLAHKNGGDTRIYKQRTRKRNK
jgi:hypothetical protein